MVNQYFVHILSLVTDNHPSGMEENDRRNYFMTNLHESMGPDGIDRVTPGSGFRRPSVARHFTDCATRPVESFVRGVQLNSDNVLFLVFCPANEGREYLNTT